MLLTKKYLNELSQKQAINESLQFSKKEDPNHYDVFISYSLHDQNFAKKVVGLLSKTGYTAYADYNDLKLSRDNVSEETAKRLVEKMQKCTALFYLHSKSSSVSKWCPWEVGLFSGLKDFKCANLPIVDDQEEGYEGQEYLGLYHFIDFDSIASKGEYDFWVNAENGNYINLRGWLDGKEPFKH